jgi:hypothetical protein
MFSNKKFSSWAACKPSAITGKHFAEAKGGVQTAEARFSQAGFAHASFFKKIFRSVGDFVFTV